VTLSDSDLRRVRSSLRLVSIFNACHEAGITTIPLSVVHTIAYFTDALAPVWGIPLVEGQLLKKNVPTSPELQADIDRLVGQAVLLATNIRYVRSGHSWSLDADYSLHPKFGPRIVESMSRDTQYVRELAFVREVVLALAGLGVDGISVAAPVDATYGDPNVGIGGIVNLDNAEEITRTTQVAKRFAELLREDHNLGEAEITHLYVRHLYSRLRKKQIG
jgi:hypothetical protein